MFSSMDTDSSRSTSHTLESLPEQATSVKHLRPGPYSISICLLNTPTSQMTAEEIQRSLAEKHPCYQYTSRQIWDYLRRGSKGEDPIFMIVNKYRAKRDPNRCAIRPEIEPQLRQLLSDAPPPQPPLLRSSRDYPQPVPAVREAASTLLCEPRTGSKHTALQEPSCVTAKSVLTPMTRANQPSPHPVPSSVWEDPLTDQSSSKRQRISYQNTSTPTQQALSTFTKDPTWITSNSSHNPEFEEAEEVRDLEHPEASISKYSRQGIVRLIASTQCNTSLFENHLDIAIGEGAALQRSGDCSNGISTFESSRKHMLYTKAAVLSPRRRVELRAKINGSSGQNLLPQSISSRLRLPLYFGKSRRIRVANHIITTKQYCQFNIRVARVKTTIDACVVSELPSLLFGREWIRQINLLSDFGNHRYYIPGPYANLTQILNLGAAITTETETRESTIIDEIAGE